MSPRSKRQNLQICDERREQILNSAVNVFARKGVPLTQMKDIAIEAGVSYGLVYHYFKSKDSIHFVVIERALEGSRALVLAAAGLSCDPWNKLCWLTNAMLTQPQGEFINNYLVMLQSFNSTGASQKIRQLINDNNISNMVELLDIFIEGQKQGQIVQGNPLALCKMFLSLIAGIYMVHLVDQTFLPDITSDMILRLIKA